MDKALRLSTALSYGDMTLATLDLSVRDSMLCWLEATKPSAMHSESWLEDIAHAAAWMQRTGCSGTLAQCLAD